MSSIVISAATETATILRAALSDFRYNGLVSWRIVRHIVVSRSIISCSGTADGSIRTIGLVPVTPATTTSAALSQLQDI